MEEMIGYCGIVCDDCPAFIATKSGKFEEKKKVAELWSKSFGIQVKPEDISCQGCLTKDGIVSGYCKMCAIRKCGTDKKVNNCAYCSDYGCKTLMDFIAQVPRAKEMLEKIRAEI